LFSTVSCTRAIPRLLGALGLRIWPASALLPALAVYSAPGAVNVPVVDNVLFDHGCECFTQEPASRSGRGSSEGSGGSGSRDQAAKRAKRLARFTKQRAAARGVLGRLGVGPTTSSTVADDDDRVSSRSRSSSSSSSSGGSSGNGGGQNGAWPAYCLHHGRRTGNCDWQHWAFRVAIEALAAHKQALVRAHRGAQSAEVWRARCA